MLENNLLLKNPVLDIADPSVSDFLIDAVRCWIGEIGVEATVQLSWIWVPIVNLQAHVNTVGRELSPCGHSSEVRDLSPPGFRVAPSTASLPGMTARSDHESRSQFT